MGLPGRLFYRNFLDKYDLINWYFDKLLVKSFEHMGQGKTVYDALVKKFTYIQEEYRKAAIDAVRKLSVDVGIPTKLERRRIFRSKRKEWYLQIPVDTI